MNGQQTSSCSGHTVRGGGRYDDLVKQLGGKDVFELDVTGFERLVELAELSDKKDQNSQPKIYLVAVGDQAGQNPQARRID